MKSYCTSPWISLFVHHDNKVKSCCAGKWDWGDLAKTPLDEILNDPKVQKLKSDIRNGVFNSYCSYCKTTEDAGGESQRKYYEQFKVSDDIYNSNDKFELQALDIRWTNLCNLNCVYCNAGWSTTWQKVLNMPLNPMHYDFHDKILDYIEVNGKKVNSVILAGGEPLMHRQNVTLIKNLSDDAKIDVITNLSIKLSSSLVYKELIKKKVNWTISIDNIGEKFEYVRHGARFNQICENLNIIKNVANFTVMLFPVYNIYNCTRLIEFYNFANEMNLPIHWQMLTQPKFMNVHELSTEIKELAKIEIYKLFDSEIFKKYNELQGYQQGYDFFNNILTNLDKTNDTKNNELKNYINIYQKKYATDVMPFAELWPELYVHL